MNEHKMLDDLVREWESEGLWVDRGRWTRAKNGTRKYPPTKREIAAKCKLFRAIGGWRGGEFSVATTAGVWRPSTRWTESAVSRRPKPC